MADKKITDMTALTTPASADVLPIVDVSEAAAADKNKKITVSELFKGVPDGTAAAPAIAFESDDDNGIFLSDTDTVGIATNGTGRLFVDSSGNVGIGSSNTTSTRVEIARLGGAWTGLAPVAGTALVTHPGGGSATSPSYINILGGNTSGGGIYFGDIDASSRGAIIYDHSTDALWFGTNGSNERLRIDSSGNVGIGTTDPDRLLHLEDDNQFFIKLERTGASPSVCEVGTSGNLLKLSNDANGIGFHTGATPTEVARIDSAGRLLVGTPSGYGIASTGLAKFQVGSIVADLHASLTDWSTVNQGGVLAFGAARGGAVGNYTIVQNGDNLGSLRFAGADGTDLQTQAASITAQVDGTPGANDMPGRLMFSTTADGASSPTERMRINSNGKINIGTSYAASSAVAVKGLWGQGIAGGMEFDHNNAITTGRADVIYFRYQGTIVGEIDIDNNDTAYRTTSDYRLKENNVSISNGIERVRQLNPYRFNWISTPAKTVDGFFAHEVQTVVPEAVTGTHNEVDDDGNPVYQGIDQSKLVPLLTAALQEAIAKIETLEQRLNDAGIA